MIRSFALAALFALCACSRQPPEPAPTPVAPTPQASTPAPPAATTAPSAPPAATTAPSAPPASAQNEIAQATASQESGDTDTAPARADASLEKLAALPATAQLPEGKWQPGVNYAPLVPAQPTGVSPGKVEVVEVFWLACPHCYGLEPFIKAWLKSKPAYVEFVRVPVMWQPIHRAHAHFYYALDALGRRDLADKAMSVIAEQHIPLAGNSEEESFHQQQEFAVKNGVSADDFAKAYNSFTVNSNLQRAEQLTQRYRVEGVPLVIVNGKYTTDVQKAGGEAKLIELINDLAAAEHRH